jgi:hypothetical protein
MNDGSFRDAVLLLIVVIFFWINQQPTIFFPWLIDEILYEMVLWCTGVLCVEPVADTGKNWRGAHLKKKLRTPQNVKNLCIMK